MARQRLRSWLWRVPVAQEVRDELAHHLDLLTRDLVEAGVSPEAARVEAERRLGDAARIADTLKQLGTERDRAFALREWITDFVTDVRFALRHARQQPGFTASVVLTLALGLGATTAIFSVVHAVLLAPFPIHAPERVLSVFTTWQGRATNTSAGNYDYIRQRASTLDPLAAVAFVSFNLADDDQPERVQGLRTTASYFQVFQVPPALGRTYTADEDQPGRNGVVVLSHGLWQRRFGGRADILGHTLHLNGESYRVIGVMPAAFSTVLDGAEVLAPIAFTPERLAMYDEHFLDMYARRKAGFTDAQVNDELARIAQGLQRDHGRYNVDRGATSQRFDESVVGPFRLRLLVLLAAVALVLVIACGNAANLLLARLAARARELSIRAALGAGRGRIVRQVLAESLVITGLGALAGVVAAWWALPVLIAAAPEGVPRLADASLNLAVLATSTGLAVASAVIVGVLPSWWATSRDLRRDLGDGKGAVTGSLTPWVRQSLIAAQAALVVVVLAAAALLVRSAINLQQVPIGIDTTGVIRARVGLPAAQYRTTDVVKASFEQMVSTLAASPGVAGAALDSQAPLVGTGGGSNGLIPEGRPLRMESVVNSRSHFVTPQYFRVLRLPLREGRMFEPSDIRSAPLVMIVNETLARAAFPDASPIGKRMSCCEGGPENPRWKIVVGVVADVRSRGPGNAPVPEFYLPLAQIPPEAWGWVNNTLDVMVRPAEGDPAALAGTIRSAVRALDPSLPVYGLSTLDDGLQRTMAQARFNTVLMSLLAATGLLLAALGIYSVIAWLVAQRTREIGVRMALGASPRQVVRQVVGHGLKPVALGLAVGLAGAVATGRWLQAQLFDVSPRDPVSLGLVALALLLAATLAAVIPARRATSIDPAQALHDA
jgi:predicted permease